MRNDMTGNIVPRGALRGLALLALAGLAACSTLSGKGGSSRDPGADKVRADLAQLEADPQLAPRAPAAIKEAEEAVNEAQQTTDPERSAHLVYIADRKVQTARALAESKVAEDQLKNLRGQ